MKEPKFSEQQIAFILKREDDGEPIAETCSNAGISLETYQRWRRKYAGLLPSEIKRLQQLEDENTRLKGLVAKLIVDKTAPPGTRPPPVPEPQPPTYIELLLTALAVSKETVRGAIWGPGGLVVRVRKSGALLASCGPVLARLLRHPHQQAPILFKTASDWVRVRLAKLSWPVVRDYSSKVAKRARTQLKGREILAGGVAAGLAGGFAFGLLYTPVESEGPATVPVDMSVRLNSYGSVSSMMESGWERPQPWGTWMTGNKASIILGFDGAARGDVELLLEARTQPIQGAKPATLIVRFNGAELGRWRLPAQARKLRRRFIVPGPVFNRSTEGQLAFEIPSDTSSATVFGVQALSLRDARLLHDFKGFVDACAPDKLVGWAVAEDSAVSVIASANGEPLKAVLTNVERPDLAPHGLPTDAGFVLTPEKPIASGTTVEVRFANGRPLVGSPCHP